MYRVNHASVELFPVQGGALYSSGPIIHGVDPTGSFDTTNALPATAANKLLESLKSVKVNNSYLGIRQSINWQNLIG
jgi:hypothetical protein